MNNNIFNVPTFRCRMKSSAREAGTGRWRNILSGWLERDLPPACASGWSWSNTSSQMRGQYPLTGLRAGGRDAAAHPDFSPDDLHQLLVTGWLDTRMVDGQRHHHEDSVARCSRPTRT